MNNWQFITLGMSIALAFLVLYRKLLDIHLLLLGDIDSIENSDYSKHTFIDKSSWPNGAWQDEPDRVVWVDRGMLCIIERDAEYGYLSGHVGVPEGHAAFGKNHIELGIDDMVDSSGFPSDIFVFTNGIEDLWDFYWFGFSHDQVCDWMPNRPPFTLANSVNNAPYRDVEYVKNECESLVSQLSEI